MTLLIISFIGGILTVLAPCVLPLLPVIVGGSLQSTEVNRKRAVVVVASLGISVMLFTFLLKISTLFIYIPESFWKWISGGIIIIFGLITLFPKLWESLPFTAKLNRDSNQLMSKGFLKGNFLGDVIVGISLGPVFSTCSPTYFLLLATVLPQSPLLAFIDLSAYTIGLCAMLLLISLVGQRIVAKLGIAADPNGWFKKVLGIIFVLVGLAIITGYDKKAETVILNSGYFDITKVEQQLLKK